KHFGRRRRGFAVVAEKFDVTSEGNSGNFTAGPVAVVKAGELRTEAERESQHLHTGPASNQEMAEFVEEDDDGENKYKRDRVADEPVAQGTETMQKNLGHRFPLSRAGSPAPSFRMPLR